MELEGKIALCFAREGADVVVNDIDEVIIKFK